MDDEIEFLKDELKKKGYPLENYVQSLLVNKKWRVQPNAYFLDKDTDKGRELDLKARKDGFVSDLWGTLHFESAYSMQKIAWKCMDFLFYSTKRI